jgi:hypothetical protein
MKKIIMCQELDGFWCAKCDKRFDKGNYHRMSFRGQWYLFFRRIVAINFCEKCYLKLTNNDVKEILKQYHLKPKWNDYHFRY